MVHRFLDNARQSDSLILLVKAAVKYLVKLYKHVGRSILWYSSGTVADYGLAMDYCCKQASQTAASLTSPLNFKLNV